ncbi:MAG TPA: tripartite tricarboxylate transporter substrate binding protein [Usitatibacter sp.]|jgi:tripartite-type tricarboxylate transporter receptor subunit TctC|nr:tripartite tricarboxylate transporter substrate binding protein [Usitatibacter sp.]
MTAVRTLLAAALLVFAAEASGQAYPTKPVKIVVAFTAGSATDILARVVAEHLTRTLGQPFIVENKPGAGGSVGTEQVKNAPPDGYTLVAAGSGPFGINPAIYSKLPYDPVRDFELIGNIVLTPQALVVGAQTPYKTLKDFVAAAKAKPGEVAYASLGNGSTSHLTMEAFQSAAGVKLNHIPFKGSSDAQTQLIGGSVPIMSDTVPGVLAQVKAGKLRALGVAIPQRSPYLPDVPTIAEQGYPGFESVGWIGLAAPAKTPPAILDRLNAELRKMLDDPAVKARLDQLAFTPVGDSRAEFTAFVKSEIAKWTQVAKASGAKAD